MANVKELLVVLGRKSKFEAVDVQETATNIRILGRVRQDGTSTPMDNWLLMMNAIAEREEKPGCPWKVDISKKYFRRGSKFIFAWRLIIQGSDLPEQLTEIISACTGSPISSRNEVFEVSLPGSRSDRNAHNNGKGAGAMGTVPVGPMVPMRGGR
jgi:hypothetical protein